MVRPVVLLACVFAACAAREPATPAVPAAAIAGLPWPHESSDLAPDPALQFARLPNGLRYVWQRHAVPPGGCSVRLIVHVGSVDEGTDEEGMAHFVEHMAFNGTQRFPGNSVVEWLRQHGMAVGPDVTAFTNAIDTTYGLDLPAADPASLREALGVLCDMTTRMAFDATEVDAEKGVIDAEERERATPRALAEWERERRLLAGYREVAHRPIGTPGGRAAFTSASLRAFHARWYRLDNMTLVLVGDVNEVPTVVAAAFGDIAPPNAPMPPRSDRGTPTLQDTRFVVAQQDRTDVEFWVFHPVLVRDRGTSRAARERSLALYIAAQVVRWMLHPLSTGHEAVITDLDVWSSEESLDVLGGVLVGFRCTAAHAQEALARVANTLATVSTQGLGDGFVQTVRNDALRRLDTDVGSRGNMPSSRVADRLVSHISRGVVPLAAAAWVDMSRAMWTACDAASITRTLCDAWPEGDPAIVAIAPAPFPFDPTAVWRTGWLAPAPPLVAPESHDVAWPYASTAAGPKPIARTHDARLDLDVATFDNGVRTLLKRVPGVTDEIRVAVCIGGGPSTLPDDQRAAAAMFEVCLPLSGLGKLSPADLDQATRYRRASLRIDAQPNAWCLRAVTTGDSLGFQLEWLLAACTDPGWSQAAIERAAEDHGPKLTERMRQPGGELDAFAARLAAQPSILLSAERFATVRLADVQTYFASTLREAGITVVVAGDIDVDATVEQVARTFGTLPPRAALPERQFLEVQRPLHEERELQVSSSSSMIALLAPLGADDLTVDRASMALFNVVLDERVRTRIREQLGASYAPFVRGSWTATNPPLMTLRTLLQTAPGEERRALDAVLAEFARTAHEGCTADELQAARKVFVTGEKGRRASAGGWVDLLAETHGEPGGLDRIANWQQNLDAVTVADVQRVAARALRPENLSTIVLKPTSR